MSRPVRDRVTELAIDVEQVRLAPAADVRARGRSRARRRLAVTGTALAALVAAGGFALTNALTPGATPVASPSGNCRYPVDLALPDKAGEVVIKVFGGAEQAGQVSGELTARGFQASGQGRVDPGPDTRGQVVVLRYGPQAIGAATLVRAVVAGDVVLQFQPDRPGRTVDLVLGSEFRRLASTTELNRSLVAVSEPTRPPGC